MSLVLETRLVRSSLRSASAVDSLDALSSRSVSAPSSAVTCSTSRRDVDSTGLKYLAASLAASPWPPSCVAKPLMTFWRSARVGASSVLTSWSRSMIVVVVSWPSVALSSSFGPVLRAGRQRDVAVGDAGERRRADDRLRALVQRGERLVDHDADRAPGCRR